MLQWYCCALCSFLLNHHMPFHAATYHVPLASPSLRMYNNVVERCFVDCVNSFKRKDLEKEEEAVRAWRG